MIAKNNPAGRWRTGETTGAGFRQFYREWQRDEECHSPMLALHGSLTQSGMWIALAERIGAARIAGVVLVDPVVRVPGASTQRGGKKWWQKND